MPIEAIIAIIVAVPVILFPVVFIWFINVTGLWATWKESRARQRRRAKARQEALVKVPKITMD